ATSAGFFWNPNQAKRYSILGDYTYSTLKSNAIYFDPGTLTQLLSQYRDNAHTATLLWDCSAPGKHGPHLTGGGSYFKRSGSRPTTYAQPLARVAMPVYEHASLFGEWRYYGLGEQYYMYEGFRTHVFMLGLRLVR